MKLGSLFDGSGGFPLSGVLCGIEPRWASEVEPYPIAVTKSRFPTMKHLGSVTDVHGGEIEPVDVITFGSPCQDLSVAGKRAGLKHEANGDEETTRSGLFMEAVRIIKEMREATNGRYPTFALWENVPGAFSSNRGEDFRIVLEELIKVVEPTAVMPPVPKGGWSYADCYRGDGWSIAYRNFDAQYWGVPQRRRRIYLVADFRGERAGEVSFERQGLRGYFAEGGTPWKGSAAYAEGSSGADDRAGDHGGLVPYTLKIRSGCEGGGKGPLIQTDQSATLLANNDQYLFQPVYSLQGNTIDRDAKQNGSGICEDAAHTLNAVDRHGVMYAVATQQGGAEISENGICPTITAAAGMSGNNQPWICKPRCDVLPFDTTQVTSPQNGSNPQWGDPCHPLAAQGHPPTVICKVEKAAGFKAGLGEKARSIGWQEEQSPTLASEAGGKSVPSVCMGVTVYESHPMDSRIRELDGISPTVSRKWHKGAADTPLVVTKTYDARGNGDGDTVSTITGDHENRVTDYSSVVVQKGFTMQGFGDYKDCEVASGLKARDYKDATDLVCGVECLTPWDSQTRRVYAPDGSFPALVARENSGQNQQAVCVRDDDAAYGVDCRNMYESPELYPTLQAKSNGGQSLNYSGALRVRYIVRRLTPTECARLQGFADRWGDIDPKDDLTDEEYKFWLNVRNTHAADRSVRHAGRGGRAEKGGRVMDYLKKLQQLPCLEKRRCLYGEWGPPRRPIKIGDRVRVWNIEGTLVRVDFDICSRDIIPTVDLKLSVERPSQYGYAMSGEVELYDVPTNEIESIEEENTMSKITVTKEKIDHLMKTAQFETFTAAGKCTVVVAQLENGFVITESSACVDPANYDAILGERICKDKIRDRLWELEGYALQKAVHKLVAED